MFETIQTAFVLLLLVCASLGMLTMLGLVFLGRARVRTLYATQLTEEPVIRNLTSLGWFSAAGALNMKARVSAKTADYTIVPSTDPSGTIFTTRGAGGAVIFTLPAPAAALAGYRYTFKNVVAQDMTVKTATVDTLIVLNDLTADSLAVTTTNEEIGGQIEAICDGTSWFASGVAVGHTYTIAT